MRHWQYMETMYMGDLREYSFGDWFGILLKVVPAYLLVLAVLGAPIVVALALFWLFVPFK